MKPKNELALAFLFLAITSCLAGSALYLILDGVYSNPEFIAGAVIWFLVLTIVLMWISYDTWRVHDE